MTGLVLRAARGASNPYLTYYAQETRMYELEAFLSLVVGLAYLKGIVRGRRALAPLLVAGLALMVYMHNWALFLCVGLAVATAVVVRERLRPVRARRPAPSPCCTCRGCPRCSPRSGTPARRGRRRPILRDLVLAPGAVLSGDAPLVACVLAGGVGLGALVRGRHERERTAMLALSVAIGRDGPRRPGSRRRSRRLDDPLLRGRRSGRSCWSARAALVRAGRLGVRRSWSILFLLGRLPGAGQQGERARDRAAVAPYVHPGRARHLDASRAGARASLLPRPRAALRDHARAGARPADLRLGRRRLAAAGDAAAAARSTG